MQGPGIKRKQNAEAETQGREQAAGIKRKQQAEAEAESSTRTQFIASKSRAQKPKPLSAINSREQ